MEPRRRDVLVNWLVAAAMVAAVAGSIVGRRWEVSSRQSSRDAATGLSITFADFIDNVEASVAECLAVSPCTDPAQFEPGRDTEAEALNSELMRQFFPEYDLYVALTYEWNHAVMEVVDDNGIVTDRARLATLANGAFLGDIRAELTSARSHLEERQVDEAHASQVWGWTWKGLLVAAPVPLLCLLAVRGRRDRREAMALSQAIAAARVDAPSATMTEASPQSCGTS